MGSLNLLIVEGNIKKDTDIFIKAAGCSVAENFKNLALKLNPSSNIDIVHPGNDTEASNTLKNIDKYHEIQEYLLNYKCDLIKEIFIFDFYSNPKNNEIKLGYRFIFQSKTSTITESEVNKVMEDIINHTLSMDSVSIPGLAK